MFRHALVSSPHTQTPCAQCPFIPLLLPSGPPCACPLPSSVLLHCNSLCLSVCAGFGNAKGKEARSRGALLQAVCLCTFLLIFPSLSPVSAGRLVDSLPASLLCISVNISFSHCPFPISTPSCLLCHASLLSSPLAHLAVPFVISGRNQKHFCPCLLPPLLHPLCPR